MKYIDVNPYDFPIQFKELNHSDFEGFSFEDEEKEIIKPNNEGYISDALNKVVELEKSNTTIVNAGVGQGKTTAIIDFIKWYYEQNLNNREKYKIIIVTPFKSLNQEYMKKLKKAISEDVSYFEYQELGEQQKMGSVKPKDFYEMNSSKPIQLISIMNIMGDSGSIHWKQSDYNREYYEYLTQKCEINNEKVILFFDEIHESLKSFKPELIANLFRWRKSTYKVFVASATFTEASKVPIKYIGELTERRLKIIESQRIQNNNNLSELHICFYNQFKFEPDNPSFKEIIEEELDNASKLNILCYSPRVASSIYRSSVGKLIREKFKSVNLCHSNNEKTFDEEACNIGTNFKTGISIEEENSVFIVIMPLMASYSKKGKKHFGIFSDGVNSLIQALARARNKSKIFIITPSPDKIILGNLKEKDKYIDKLSLEYMSFDEEKNQAPYIDLNMQDSILKDQYNTLKTPNSEAIEYLANLNDELKLQYWEYDWFKLSKGDENLRQGFDIFGKSLPNYLYWAAWNNQFSNCKLVSIRKSSVLIFKKGEVQNQLEHYYPSSFVNDESFKDISDKTLYEMLRNNIFSNNVYYNIEDDILKLEEEGIEIENTWDKYLQKIKKNTDSIFEQQIIHFLQRRKTPHLFESNSFEDVKLNKVDYIKKSIAQCRLFFESEKSLNSKDFMIIDAYRDLYNFKEILLNEYTIENKKKDKLLPIEKNIKLTTIHIIKLRRAFNTLLEFDEVLKVFSNKNLLKDSSLITILREVFFESSITTIKEENRKVKYWKITEHPYPNTEYDLNLIYNTDDPWLHYPIPPNLLIKDNSDEDNDENWYNQNVVDASSYFTDNDRFM